MSACRCGHRDGEGPHPCHADDFRCGRPAKQRLYNARPAVLAGMQMKLTVTETWACDECWERFRARLPKGEP